MRKRLPGKLFENKYQALWPDTDVIRKETDEVYNRICEDGKFKEVMDVLLEFAEKLRLLPFHHAQCINPRWNISATFATIRAIAIRTILASFLPGCFIFP